MAGADSESFKSLYSSWEASSIDQEPHFRNLILQKVDMFWSEEDDDGKFLLTNFVAVVGDPAHINLLVEALISEDTVVGFGALSALASLVWKGHQLQDSDLQVIEDFGLRNPEWMNVCTDIGRRARDRWSGT